MSQHAVVEVAQVVNAELHLQPLVFGPNNLKNPSNRPLSFIANGCLEQHLPSAAETELFIAIVSDVSLQIWRFPQI